MIMQSHKFYNEDKPKHSFPFWNTSKKNGIFIKTAERYESEKLRVVIVGDKESGKNAITVRFIHENLVVKYDPYDKNCYRKQIEVDGKNCTIDIMDSAGQDEFIALKDQYMKTGQILMVAFSVLSKESFAQVPKSFESIKRVHDRSFNLEFPYVILVGNNIDEGEKRVIDITESQNLADKYLTNPLIFEFQKNHTKNYLAVVMPQIPQVSSLVHQA